MKFFEYISKSCKVCKVTPFKDNLENIILVLNRHTLHTLHKVNSYLTGKQSELTSLMEFTGAYRKATYPSMYLEPFNALYLIQTLYKGG